MTQIKDDNSVKKHFGTDRREINFKKISDQKLF